MDSCDKVKFLSWLCREDGIIERRTNEAGYPWYVLHKHDGYRMCCHIGSGNCHTTVSHGGILELYEFAKDCNAVITQRRIMGCLLGQKSLE